MRFTGLALSFAAATLLGTADEAFAGGRGRGHFHGGVHTRVFVGATFVAAPFYYPYAYPYYSPAPVYYAPPPVYMEPPAPQENYWYYCAPSRAYYPYVQDCPGGWQRVAPQPAG